jgi:hypothetical protein
VSIRTLTLKWRFTLIPAHEPWARAGRARIAAMSATENRRPPHDQPDPGAAPSDGAGPVPVHRRTIEFEAYDAGETLTVTGRLRDERPWATGTDRVEHVHDMDLALSVGKEDLTIVAAAATMERFPHAECPGITPSVNWWGSPSAGATRALCRNASEGPGGARISSSWPAPSVLWSSKP